jgi:hypothetical protein
MMFLPSIFESEQKLVLIKYNIVSALFLGIKEGYFGLWVVICKTDKSDCLSRIC